MEKKITKNTPIMDVVEKYPETAEVFFSHGMHCLGCVAARFENIEQGATAHHIDADKLVDDLNKKIDEKKSKKEG